MAGQAMLRLDRIGQQVWSSYRDSGDFAVFNPDNPASDDSGMFHVKLADWDIAQETMHKEDGSVSVVLRRKGVDDQGRTE